MKNPFDDPEATFMVLVNSEGQHSLWPAAVQVPDGWQGVIAKDTRQNCLAYIEENWRDMRPKSLILAMDRPGNELRH